jgi:hypothetical protein
MGKRRKLLNQKKKHFSTKKTKSFAVYCLLIVFVSTSIYLIARNVTSGGILVELEEEEAMLTKKKDTLSHQLFEKTSLIKIQNKTEELGYTKPQDTMYIRSDDTVAAIP